MRAITFRKPFHQLEEAEALGKAIVTYVERPYKRRIVLTDSHSHTVIESYEHHIIIDLWLVIINVHWIK